MLTKWRRRGIAAAIVLSALIAPSAASLSICPGPPLRGDAMDKIDDALQARLDGGAAAQASSLGITAWHLTISHSRTTAAAVAIAVAENEAGGPEAARGSLV